MKVLIYIPKSIKEIENCKNCPIAIQGVCAALRETVPKEGKRVNCPAIAEISDNATNGDVIKALFPSMNFKFGGFGIDDNGNSIHTASIYPNGERLTEDWLNAPYKK